MIAVSFLLSVFLRRGASAVNMGFVIFIVGWITQSVIAFGYPYSPEYAGKTPVITAIFTLLPWSLLAKGAIDLGAATANGNDVGISWAQRSA